MDQPPSLFGHIDLSVNFACRPSFHIEGARYNPIEQTTDMRISQYWYKGLCQPRVRHMLFSMNMSCFLKQAECFKHGGMP